MTGYIEQPGVFMPLSRMTIATMQDLGYQVDYSKADLFVGNLRAAGSITAPATMINERIGAARSGKSRRTARSRRGDCPSVFFIRASRCSGRTRRNARRVRQTTPAGFAACTSAGSGVCGHRVNPPCRFPPTAAHALPFHDAPIGAQLASEAVGGRDDTRGVA